MLSRTTPAEAEAVARRIHDALRTPMTISGRTLIAQVTVGGALGAPGDTAPTELLRRADAAMYAEKVDGKGRHHLGPVEILAAGRAPAVPAAVGPVG